MDQALVIASAFAVVAATTCALGAILANAHAVLTRSQEPSPGMGCALLGLLWAFIAALLLWTIRG